MFAVYYTRRDSSDTSFHDLPFFARILAPDGWRNNNSRARRPFGFRYANTRRESSRPTARGIFFGRDIASYDAS